MLPIIPGVIPFGAIMGTVAANAHISFFQSSSMNLLVFAGAAQLAAVDLMTKNTASAVVIITGLIINLRFMLYSAAMAPFLHKSRFFTKFLAAYALTDQTYAAMMANHNILKTNSDAIEFYIGASVCMFLGWQFSVVGGFIFGNFAPSSWSLDYAVPLSFMALLIPTLKNRNYVFVALFSAAVSLLLSSLPYKSGLIVTAFLSILFGVFLSRKRLQND